MQAKYFYCLTNPYRSNGGKYDKTSNYVKDHSYINGLSEYELEMKEHLRIEDSSMLSIMPLNETDKTQLNFTNFKPGSIVAIK